MSKDEHPITRALELLRTVYDKTDIHKVVGQPVTRGDETIIPLSQFAYGFRLEIGDDPGSTKELRKELPIKTEEVPSGLTTFRKGHSGGWVWTSPVAVIHINKTGVRVTSVIGSFSILVMFCASIIAVMVWIRAWRTYRLNARLALPAEIRLTPDDSLTE